MITNISFRDALNEALKNEMSQDPDVFIFGLDVDDHKSIFGSTKDLKNIFGTERVFGTPLSEDAMTGFAIGAALRGKKTVHVHIRADFSLLAVNQIINVASNIHYLTAGQLNVPLTIRVVVGRGWGQGFQHSKSVHSLFAHFPGLKVLIPANPQEAYSLLRMAIQDKNPTLFIEHRWLYDVVGPVDYTKKPQAGAVKLTDGKDITILANSWMSIEALKAREILEKINIRADIFNINSLVPLQLEEVINSVKKTGHCVVVDHDWVEFGLAAELSARIHEAAFHQLKKPIKRIGHQFVPCPTARPLENQFYAKAQHIIEYVCILLDKPVPKLNDDDFYTYENKFKGPF